MVTNILHKCDVVDYSTVKPDDWGHEYFQSGATSIVEWIEEIGEGKQGDVTGRMATIQRTLSLRT